MKPIKEVEKSILGRFLAKVGGPAIGDSEDCNIWLGCQRSQSKLRGKLHGGFKIEKKFRSAHRLAYEWFVGDIPSGMKVMHRCGLTSQGSCVNPRHLYLGTDLDNARDRMNDGTGARGERIGNSKLTEDIVRRIWESRGKSSQANRIKFFGVARSTLQNIDHGFSWNCVTGLPRKRPKYDERRKRKRKESK